jgi:hypothetical protein
VVKITRARDLATGVLPGTWISYTPALSGMTIGNGTIGAAYSQIGKTVTVRVYVSFGSTSTQVGTFYIGLPVPKKSYGLTTAAGTHYCENSGIVGYSGFVNVTPPTGAILGLNGASSTVSSFVGANTPFVWGTADFFDTTFTYEAA